MSSLYGDVPSKIYKSKLTPIICVRCNKASWNWDEKDKNVCRGCLAFEEYDKEMKEKSAKDLFEDNYLGRFVSKKKKE